MNRLTSILFSCFVSLACGLNSQASTLTRLGDFPQGISGSAVNGISGDGTTIVGGGVVLDFPSVEAARWTTSGIISALRDDVSDDGLDRNAKTASQDGSVIIGAIGERPSILSRGTGEAFRWTEEAGIVTLGFLPGSSRSGATDVSGDGSIVIGSSSASGGQSFAYRWTSETGMVSLGTLPTDFPESTNSHSTAISADGSVIVGTSNSQAFRWTEQTGLVGLGDLPGGFVSSGVEDISSDGSVIVGSSSSELSQGSTEAYRWTAATGMQGLGFLNPTDHTSSAQFTSNDGRLVFGLAFDFDGFRYFVWDPHNGMRDLLQVLDVEFGLANDLAGWTQFIPRDISDDGLSLVGSGINPDGNLEGWLIQLDHPIGVPEPATATLLLVGMSVSLFMRQRFLRA